MHYHVAHNGVLENTQELIEEFIGPHDNPVDSSIIPILLSFMYEFGEDEPDKTPELTAIEAVCSMLKGTFGCWIQSKLTGDTYLVRSGSTLYGDILKGNFSSTRVPEIANTELKEGVVYCVTSEGLAECGEFETNSPFFL
jgi:glucosamine 6-phosphate synthetase-like amidotransferase/phosphosugar isomerase protein